MPLPCFRRHNSIFDAHGEKGTRVCAREGGSAPGGEGNQLRVGLKERRGVCCCCRSYGWKAGVREGRQGGGHAVFPMEMGSRCGQLISLSLRDAATHPIVADGHAGNLCGGAPWGTYLRLSKGLGAINGDVWDPPDRRRHGPGGRRRGRRRSPPSGPGASAIQRKDTTYPYYIYINAMYLVGKNVPDLPPEASRQD